MNFKFTKSKLNLKFLNKKFNHLINNVNFKELNKSSKLNLEFLNKKFNHLINNVNLKELNKSSKLNLSYVNKKSNHYINNVNLKELKSYFDLREIDSEKAILLFSIISGLLLSTIIFCAVNIPLSRKNKNLQEDIKSFTLKKTNIPEAKLQFKKVKLEANDLNEKRKFLIKLIAGTKNLDTFLAVLNENALKNEVRVVEFVPQKIINFKNSDNVNNDNSLTTNNAFTSNRGPSPTNNNEPILNKTNNVDSNEKELLIIPELEKHEIEIALEGNYIEILSFIRDIELLENIVLTGDFKIKRLEDFTKTDSSKIEYKAAMSAFGLNKNMNK